MPDPAQLLEFLQATSEVGLCWLDADQHTLHCEPEARRLLRLGSAQPLSWAQLLGHVQAPAGERLAAAAEAAWAGRGSTFDLLLHLRGEGGMAQPLRLNGRLQSDAAGRPQALLMAVRRPAPVIEPVLEHAVAAAGIGLFEMDMESGEQRWSSQTLALYGLPPDTPAPTRQQWRERFLHPNDAAAQAERVAAQLREGLTYEMDYRIRRVDGEVRWLHTRAAMLGNGGRRVIGLSMDITQRKEAELRAAEAWQLLDLSAAQVGFGFGYRDRGFGRGHWSSQLKMMYGLPPAAPTPNRHELLQWIAPESRERVAAHLQREAAIGEVIEYRYDILRVSDGARRTLLTRSVWLADASGAPWRICFATVDITDQLARERQMNEALQRLQLATQALGIGTWERDVDAERGTWDDTTLALFGLPPDALPPTTEEYLALVHPEDRGWLLSFHPSRRTDEPDLDITFRVRPDAAGQVRWLHVIGRGQRNASGRVVRRVGLCMDVTQRRQAEEALQARELAERASQAKTEFLSRMSHELRTPLNAVLGFAQLMALDTAAPLAAPQRQRLQHVQDAGWHLLALIDDVLDLTGIESRQAPLQPQWLQPAELLAEVLAMNEPAAAAQQLALQGHGSEGAPALWCDRRRLKQVLLNLVSNAIKYNRPQGRVDVTLTCDDHECRWSVRDTGLGIEPARLPQLFQPFNRLGREHSAVRGTGIGLTLSRQIAELMGGRLEVRSEPGEGSEFILVLPRSAAGSATG
jgi:PAS domain S-box-containing protein